MPSRMRIRFQDARGSFFDAKRVVDMLAFRKRIAFIRIGRFVMVAAQDLLKFERGPSAPGEPPHSHTGILRNFIRFTYDDISDSVVIGPLKAIPGVFKTHPLRDFGPGSVEATGASVLEFGGVVERLGAVFTIKERPYMIEALRRSTTYDKLRDAWAEAAFTPV